MDKKRCFIENDPEVGSLPREMIRRKLGSPLEESMDYILVDAHTDMAAVVDIIGKCDEVYVATTYPIILGKSASMLDYLQEIAFQKEWTNKQIINILPRGQMEYTQIQLLRIEEAKKRNIIYLHIGDIIPGF